MKKLIGWTMALVMVLTAVPVLADTLVMATNATFPPYEYYDGETVVGLDVDIAKAVAEKMGYELEVADMEFDAIIPAVSSGKAAFGLAGMTVTEERKQMVDFSDSYATGIQAVIVKVDSPITSVDDLLAEGAKHTVGVQLTTTGDIYTTTDIEEAGKGTVQRFASGTEAVMALMSGKIDCVVIDKEPAKAYVANHPELKLLDTDYAAEDYAACFAKGSDLLPKFNEALKALVEDGTIAEIIAKYIKAE